MTRLALNLRRWNSTPTALALAGALVLAGACGKDDPKGGGGDGSSSGSSSGDPTTGTTSSTTAMADSSSGGVDGSSSSDGGPVVLSISGIARDFFAMAPLVGAELSLLDEPGFETVTDDAGNYVIEGLAPDSFHRIAIAGNDSYWGAVVPARLGSESLDDYDLSQVSNDVIDIQIGALQMQDPMVMVDETAAVFLIALRQNTATGAVVTIVTLRSGGGSSGTGGVTVMVSSAASLPGSSSGGVVATRAEITSAPSTRDRTSKETVCTPPGASGGI